MADIIHWEENFSGDIYNTNSTKKVGINNGDPENTLDVIGSIGLTEYLEFKKPGHDVIQASAASEFGYDFRLVNSTDGRSLVFIDYLGRLGINTTSNTARLTVVEDRLGNAWPAASFTNVSDVGFGLEVTGGNFDNHILVLKNYADNLRGTLNGEGKWWTKSHMTSDNGTSAGGNMHFIQANGLRRFSQDLIDLETGVNNEGSNFIWRRYADDSTLLGNILKIYRNTGAIEWYNNMTITGNLTVTGTITAGQDTRTLEQIKNPTGQNGKILVVENELYVFKLPGEVFTTDLSNYYTKSETNNLLTELEDSIPGIIDDYLETGMPTLEQVATAGNTTSKVLISTAGINTPVVNVGNRQITNNAGTLKVNGNTYIQGLLSFDSIALRLWQLTDVSDSVANAVSGSILQFMSGTWVASPYPTTDLSNYYTKTQSDVRFVNIPGDTMTGPLIIGASGTNLRLNSQDGTTAFAIYPFTNGSSQYDIMYEDDKMSINYATPSYFLNKSDLGTIMHVDSSGIIYFGDSTKSLNSLGNTVVQNNNPTQTLHNLTDDSVFRIIESGGVASFQLGDTLSFNNIGTPLVLSKTAAELYYSTTKRFETIATGARVTGDLETTSAHVNGVHIYKAIDGSLIIDGDVNITGKYLEDWAGVGTGNPPGAWTLDELNDVALGASDAFGINFPFVLGRNTASGAATALTAVQTLTMIGGTPLTTFNAHANSSIIHITAQERLDWNEAYNNISDVRNWDLSYSSYTTKEIGLAHVNDGGSAISNDPAEMKYLFYWAEPGGDKRSIKTRFSDNSDRLGLKPADEYRHARAVGFSGANCDTLFQRSLLDLGTTTVGASNVPEDGSWQVETLDASYIFNQNSSENIKHKHQFAIEWVDRENNFNMWARTHDGAAPEWLPWVQFMHSGNTPSPLDLYPTLPNEVYVMLQNESNWVVLGSPEYEVYIGAVSGPGWSINIGQRIVDDYYVYEATPTGMRRFSKSKSSYLYDLLDVNFAKYGQTGEPSVGDILIYQGNGVWESKPNSAAVSYNVQELTISLTDSTETIDGDVDRLEITALATLANDFIVLIDYHRDKPLTIDLNNASSFKVSIYYNDPVGPNTLLIQMQPDSIIEVHPGIWEIS